MSGLRDAIREMSATGRRTSLIPTSRLAAVVATLPVAKNTPSESPEDLGALQARLAERYDSVRIDGLSLKEFRELPLGFWHGPAPLDRHGSLHAHFLDRLRFERFESVMRRLVNAFLERYPLDAPTFAATASFIDAELAGYRSAYHLLGSEWRAFSGSGGAKRLGAEVLKSGTGALEQVGLPEHLWTFRFVEEVFRDACRQLKTSDAVQTGHLRLFAERPNTSREQALRFPGSKAELFEGLLGPWRDKPPPPDSPAKQAIMAIIDRVAGDPRTSSSNWVGISDTLKRVYLRWLAAASLKQFLDIVEGSLRGSVDGARMWPDRRRFWTAWFQTGLIDEAWVAFGPAAFDDARQVSARDKTFGSNYAKVEPAPTGYHSALMMKIGDHTAVEWSHSGRCWIWPNSTSAPKVGARAYRYDELRHAPIDVVHREGWQHRINDELRKLTGHSLRPKEWS